MTHKTPWDKLQEQANAEGSTVKERKEIANHIVKCVNMHDELVEALEKLRIAYIQQFNEFGGIVCTSVDEAQRIVDKSKGE